jgi:hypothetical protein
MRVGSAYTTVERIKAGYTLASITESGEWWYNRTAHLYAYLNKQGTVLKVVPE